VTAPVVGATQLHHLDDAVAAVGLALEPGDVEELTGPYRARPVLGHR
jgi:1-deoxyxylulose-5-phosphate synthase